MSKPKRKVPAAKPEALFIRIVSILEQARSNVVRAVNTNMVLAYWLIGQEIVQDLQAGEARAEYGEKVIADLSARLTERYGKGFSKPVLWSFRQFYMTYPDRVKILFPLGRELADIGKLSPAGRELTPIENQYPVGTKSSDAPFVHPAGDEIPRGFSPQLSWSHYRALMRVENRDARDFYEREAIAGGWGKRTLERQIQSFYHERILKSHKPEKMLAEGRNLPVLSCSAADELKNPYVLEFLGLPDAAAFHESNLEQAIITVLNDRKQIFASKYMLCLPTEEQLRHEVEKERRLIESALEESAHE